MFLAGDAAHIHSPAGGQGMNTGIQDATTWAGSWPRWPRAPRRRCSTATRPSGDRSRPACSRSRTLAWPRRSSGTSPHPPRRQHHRARPELPRLGPGPGRPRRDGRTPGRRPRPGRDRAGHGGRRAPAVRPDPRRALHAAELRGRAGRSKPLRSVSGPSTSSGNRPAPDDIADTDGYLARAYGATERTLVLIRPDGYIGLISDAGDVSAVSDYLAAIG